MNIGLPIISIKYIWIFLFLLTSFLFYKFRIRWKIIKKANCVSREKSIYQILKRIRKVTSSCSAGVYCSTYTKNIIDDEFPEFGHYDCKSLVKDDKKEHIYNKDSLVLIEGMLIIREAFAKGVNTRLLKKDKNRLVEKRDNYVNKSVLSFNKYSNGYISLPIGNNKSKMKLYTVFIITSLGGISPSTIEFDEKIRKSIEKDLKEIQDILSMVYSDFIPYEFK